jgi:signal transduction histidine kinase
MIDWLGTSSTWLRRLLSLFGITVITWSVTALYLHHDIALWVFLAVLVANLAWLLLMVVSTSSTPLSWVLVVVMVGAGGISAAAVGGSAIVPAAVAVLWVTRDIRQPIGRGVAVGIAAMIVVLAGELLVSVGPLGAAGLEAGIVVAFLAGQSRRQYVLSEVRSREQVEEQARTDVLAARTQIASDIHDVLAHSLGGLVIQLDAVDALLESGDTKAAAGKVRDARALAAEGLGEARRAVAALSEPPAGVDEAVPGESVVADVTALVDSHRALGGRAKLIQSGPRTAVSAPVAIALRRAVQEGLTNARKHAPGRPVTVALRWGPHTVELEISNPLGVGVGVGVAASGGGHGLVGMRERFAALPGGAVSAAAVSDSFVVTVRAQTA